VTQWQLIAEKTEGHKSLDTSVAVQHHFYAAPAALVALAPTLL
jgi:hypothetical protein